MTIKNYLEKSLFKSMSIGVINQLITSGTNFLVSLYLLSIYSTGSFGQYGVFQAFGFVIAGLGNVLFLSQMVVNYPDIEKGKKSEYLTSVLVLIVCFGLLLFLTALLVGVISTNLFTVFAIVLFSLSFLFKEFFCRISYTHKKEERALFINCSIAIVLVILLFFLDIKSDDSPVHIIFVYACSYIAGAIVGGIQLRLIISFNIVSLFSTLKQFWYVGKWALLNEGLVVIRQQAHIFVTAIIIGPIGVGLINAAKMFLTPIMLVTPSLSQVYLARLVSLRKLNPKGLFKMARFFSLLNTVMVLAYGGGLFFIYEYLYELVIPDNEYQNLEDYVIPWFFFSVIVAFRYGLESAQKAMKNFKLLTLYNIPVAIVSLFFVTFFSYLIGGNGAIWGLVIAETLFAILLFVKTLKQITGN